MSVTSTLKRVGRAPFHAIGLDVVRRKQRNPKVFPTWLERLQHAKFDNDYCLYDLVDCHYRPYDGALTGGDFIFVKNGSALRAYKGWE